MPLETDPSAALAYALDDSPLWDFEIAGFRRGDFSLFGRPAQGNLFFMQPYRPGRIPIVFVHGTASSPARWAQMLNELQCDPRIASRYQFWFFMYNSGNPISDSAMHLRENLRRPSANWTAGPGRRPARHGRHRPQPGRAARQLTVVDSGTRFWDDITACRWKRRGFGRGARHGAPGAVRHAAAVRQAGGVHRHAARGQLHGRQLRRALARRFITLPGSLTKTTLELIKLNPAEAARTAIRIPTAIDNMSWGNNSCERSTGCRRRPGSGRTRSSRSRARARPRRAATASCATRART